MKRKASFYTESDYYSDSDEDSLSGEHLDTNVPPLPPVMSAPDTNFLTPHRATAGGVQMGAANTSANHQHLHQELSGKVTYDDPAVFKRLRVFDEDATSIARCHKEYQTEMKSNIDTLIGIAKDASRESAGVEPEADIARKRKRKLALKSQEKLMYDPLVRPVLHSAAERSPRRILILILCRTKYLHSYAPGEIAMVRTQGAISSSRPPSRCHLPSMLPKRIRPPLPVCAQISASFPTTQIALPGTHVTRSPRSRLPRRKTTDQKTPSM